jgi:acyl-coenzyme A thioesterase PaaI-like protein
MTDNRGLVPFAEMMGIIPVSIQPGRLVARSPVPGGSHADTLHAAMIQAATADNALVYAAMSLLDEGLTAVTVRLSVQWLRPADLAGSEWVSSQCVVEDIDGAGGIVSGQVLDPSGCRLALCQARVRIVPRARPGETTVHRTPETPPMPLASWMSLPLQVVMDSSLSGRGRYRAVAAPFLSNSIGYLHGGATTTLALGACDLTLSDDDCDRGWRPADLDVRFLSPVPAAGGDVDVVCETSHSSRSTTVMAGSIHHEATLAALFQTTWVTDRRETGPPVTDDRPRSIAPDPGRVTGS